MAAAGSTPRASAAAYGAALNIRTSSRSRKGGAADRRQSQKAGLRPTNVPPAPRHGRWLGNSLDVPRLRANRRRSCRVAVPPLDTQWQKFAVPHCKEIAARCHLPVAGSERSIRATARVARRRPGASAPPRLLEDRTTRARVEEAPVPLVPREMRAAARVRGFPRWQCFAARRSPRAPRAGIRATLCLTTSIATATPSGFPPAENTYR